ncbi:hypothetical protein PVAND_001099 [Polypedilum vanderplanki]|uniref:Uncharacterized protein n=1 Tax=Polypedilum vanderplanki TaxID=319348 RepID=A0A9J6BM73_POLVA|nr:hypothetical protein PVAND_001099 [Polypedilum vanderplanki]
MKSWKIKDIEGFCQKSRNLKKSDEKYFGKILSKRSQIIYKLEKHPEASSKTIEKFKSHQKKMKIINKFEDVNALKEKE